MSSGNHIKKQVFLAAVTALFLFATGREAYPRFSLDNRWRQLETKHTVIHYENFEDLKDFDSSIDYSPDGFSLRARTKNRLTELTRRFGSDLVDAIE